MAFGFGFNKQKVLNAAEKFVQQGKLQNAIAEYEKILKHDAKDLTVTNTVGDLYARLGDTAKAVECFKTVGDAYAGQGFTVKGIAIYKKITKLLPSVDGSLKLAELYTQQGLFNDARAQYLQVAEDFMKGGDFAQAVRLFQKVLEMDPENVSMRVKLAEVYLKLGKKKDAWEIFSAAAESSRARGSLAAAEDILQRMLKLEPGNSYVLLLRGRAALEGDDPKHAIEFLEKAADLDSHREGLRDLLKAYLQTGDVAQAIPLAEKLLSVHNDPEGLFLLAEGSARVGQYPQALDVYTRHADRLLAADSGKLLASLHVMIGHVRDDAGALDTLLQLLNKAGESTHVAEVTELLAHASVKGGNYARARDLYQALAATEPQNQLHMQNHQQMLERLSGASPANRLTPEEGEVIVEELEATAAVIDQSYPDHLAIAVRSAVTDADLFLSYNLPEKAIVPLLGILPQAPEDVRLNQRLAGLHTRARRFTEAAVCCRTLEGVYHDAGYPDEAVRYGELAARYEQSVAPCAPAATGPPAAELASGTKAASSSPAAPWPMAAPPPPEPEMSAHSSAQPEFEVQALPVQPHPDAHDLSSEWEHSLSIEHLPAPLARPAVEPDATPSEDLASNNPEVVEIVEEARFYLEHFMTDQARAALERLESLTSDASILEPLRAQIDSASGQAPAEPEAEIMEVSADETPGLDAPEFELHVESHPKPEIVASHDLPAHIEPAHAETVAAEPAHPEPVHAETGELSALVADLESSLGDFPKAGPPAREPLRVWPAMPSPQPPAAPAPVVAQQPLPVETAAPEPSPVAASAAAAAMGVAATAAPPSMSYGPAPVRPLGAGAQAMHPSDSIDLSEMFGELKQELEEGVVASDEDPETHYNLGVAFREMGLLDEAIAELQKVCTAIDHGHAFTQTIQTYTWLAQCFLDKGVPEAAIRWYEKALAIPGLDQESRVAIDYELGSACETAQDRPAALRHFTDVYGANIDYRDVAERIQALKS
ncbi:MAG TPA: tetratricopeptide repeat protein [Terriglobales bacterium]|nr:tetratricopeptide repeat protein [Terriglobales bacterium]